MKVRTIVNVGELRQRVRWLPRFFLTLTLLVSALGPLAPAFAPSALAGPADAPLAQTNTLTLNVISTPTKDQVAEYKYLINVDNTGDPTQDRYSGCYPTDPGYPDSCDWPSIREVPGSAPIYTQGNQDDFNGVLGTDIDLADGKYLVSVLADGYKVGGAHFTVPLADPGQVTVELQPNPLPAATMRIKVFEDISPVNGQFDAPAEQGLAGFTAVINDTVGQISTDVFGNPLCTTYDADGNPTGQTDCLTSDANGDIVIPNLGPLRYDVLVNAPDGTDWLETTTLEGSPSWDTWLQEGGTGLDNEFVVAGEPFPWTIFGFVRPQNNLAGGSGGVTGTLVEASVYLPQQGALPYFGDIWTGFNGTKVTGPITDGWIALSDLQNGDTAVYVGPANPDGTFSISGVPDGNYLFTWWDTNLHHILDWIQVTVSNGQMYDIGTPFLTPWFTKVEGYVFIDENKNGARDPGEPGKADYLVVLRDRDNSEIDRMSISAITDHDGYYVFEKAYPMGSWMVLEAYNDRYYTTGVTYQVDNQIDANGNPVYTTVPGNGVDVGILPILGQPARLDWGIHPYETGTNGGIVGSVFYDTTRNELDPQYQAVEPWAAGIPNLTMNLWAPVPCTDPTTQACDARGDYQLDTDGSYLKGTLLNITTTEIWEQPTGCTARDANGVPLPWGSPDQELLPTDGFGNQDTSKRCLEAPLMGTQLQSGFATLDGNWGFGDGCFVSGAAEEGVCNDPNETPAPLGAGDYLVEVVIPEDDVQGRSLYQVVREEDINIFGGDQYIPAVPPPACAGALHTVDVANDPSGIDGYPEIVGDGGITNNLPVGVTVPASTSVDNASFADGGGSPFESMQKPLCETKLVNLANGKSVAPLFTLFTEVPIPGKWKGYIIDDLTVSTDPLSLNFGEKAGIANSPIGIYDFTNRLVTTIQSDPNGVFEVLLPSTHTMNCPTPSGVCANVYYMLGNDPGQPGALNENYNPQYRTIGASFEIYPGLIIPSDLAPTQIVPGVLAAGSQFGTPPQCTLDAATPQLFAVSQPYANLISGAAGAFTITGQGFGASGQVTLDGLALPTTAWSGTQIDVTVPAFTPVGPHQLEIRTANGQRTINGLTFHVLGFGPFPGTPVLDDFNRNGWGSNWSADSVFTAPTLSNQNVRVTGTGSMRWRGDAGGGPVYGANQEAYFTFVKVSPTATEQGVFLKVTGNGSNPNPTATQSAYIEVSYNAPAQSVQVRTKANGTNTVVLQATFNNVTFGPGAGDTLGARALADGTVIAYKNGVEIGRVNVTTTANPWPVANASADGRLGIRFVGAQNNTTNDARLDNFGGGTVAGYMPNLYEVGSGKLYATIQSAIDAAAASAGNDLVVVYPGPTAMWNAIGAYYENLLIYTPIKLQGVGPGGPGVLGSVVDGRGVAGDTAYADAWRAQLQSLTWDGNQAMYEGPVVYVLAESGEFTAGYKASIDGLTLQGGDQQGFPANLVAAANPTIKEFAAVQGGGIFANAYARYLQITNNIMQSNGGAYAGAIRLGTPHLAGAFNDNQNDSVRIAHNRILANGGTNLAGAVGIFSGAEGYEVAYNDICGNFSAEYGGGISHYGLSPNGAIHHNRVYFNRSYDEAGGIMIAGELPADPATLSPGAGPVNVYNNLIQNNLGNDDGGGLRFLMSGNFPYNVYNNIIVNNVSTHEGGGVSINDAPDVRVYNNTIMKNITTATAMTSNGFAAPAGLSTSLNSALLQASLAGTPFADDAFSNPILFNNIFWDNRAGTFTGGTVAGIGLAGDPNPIQYWDLGVADGSGQLSPTNTLMQTGYGTIPGAGNIVGVDPSIVSAYDTSVSVQPWRGNPRFVDILMVTALADANLLGDYHLSLGSPAIDMGALSKDGINAPAFDFDNGLRVDPYDIGADEFGVPAAVGFAPAIGQPERAPVVEPIPTPTADLALSMADAADPVTAGENVTYTLSVSNNGPDAAQNVTLTNSLPESLSFVSAMSTQGNCMELGGQLTCSLGEIPSGGSASVELVVTATTAGVITNNASVSSDTADPNADNNSAGQDTTVDAAPAPVQEPAPVTAADLVLSVVDAVDPVTEGENVTYTLSVSNNGPDPAQNVILTDTLPAGVAFVSAAPSQGSCLEADGQVTCSLGEVASGASAAVELVVTTTAAGAITNSASVGSDTMDPNPADNSASQDTTIDAVPAPVVEPTPTPVVEPTPATMSADLGLSLVDAVDPVKVGDVVIYSVSVSNQGPDAAQNVTLTDNLPAGVAFVSATATQGSCLEAGGVVTCSLGEVLSGNGASVEVLVKATAAGVITNNASVGSDTVDPNPADNSASQDTKIRGRAK